MDDPLLMGMLDGLANPSEQFQSLPRAEAILVAVVGQGDAADELHHEIGPARIGLACVEHVGDIGMVHQGQGLSLGLQSGDHLPGVHARLDDLQGHFAAHRLVLFGLKTTPMPPSPIRSRSL